MKVRIIGSTKPEFVLHKEEAMKFAGKAAGICYMPEDFDAILQEDEKKTLKRANGTLMSGHHSVYDHIYYNLLLENVPKILAMILNNEGIYTTSEKSARYTKMEPSPEEQVLYDKWFQKFYDLIFEKYMTRYLRYFENDKNPYDKAVTAIKKLAQENARYMISVFTNTTMEYTVSFRQLNYILTFFENFIAADCGGWEFNIKLKSAMKEFVKAIPEEVKELRLNSDEKDRKLSIFDERESRTEYFGETYCTTYKGTFAQYAQAHRHRTLWYKMRFLDNFEYYVPELIRDSEELSEEWGRDITSVAHLFPQGMLISIRERGTYENFILKCQERLCGCAQLEIALQTKKTLNKYLAATKASGEEEIHNYLSKYSKGARCTFPKFNCSKMCVWGPKDAFTRKI